MGVVAKGAVGHEGAIGDENIVLRANSHPFLLAVHPHPDALGGVAGGIHINVINGTAALDGHAKNQQYNACTSVNSVSVRIPPQTAQREYKRYKPWFSIPAAVYWFSFRSA